VETSEVIVANLIEDLARMGNSDEKRARAWTAGEELNVIQNAGKLEY